MGWIYDPIRDRLATTEKGAGARLEGERLHVARPKPVAQSRGLLGERLFPPTAQTAIEVLNPISERTVIYVASAWNTFNLPPETPISRCQAGCIRGITRLAYCCTRNPEDTTPCWMAARTHRPSVREY